MSCNQFAKGVSEVPVNTFFIQKSCDRCRGSLNGGRSMSFFTKQTLCMECSAKEDEIRKRIREQDGDLNADLKYEGVGVVPKVE